MDQTTFIPVFTPSQASPDDLEKIFVQRHALLRDAEDRVREGVGSGNKHHLLFVGPRGSGKTHFVSLLVHRLGSDPELEQKLDIAWLNEDETCTSLVDLLIKIYEALSKRYPTRFGREKLEPVYEKEPMEAERFLGTLLLDQLGGRTFLIVVENLDTLFQSIGDEGQKRLRAYLQEHPVFALVATAQALVDDLTDRNGPFFGFFQTEHLKPLSFNDAVDLLGKIAGKNKDDQLTSFLATAKGRSRVRALHFLSGGNHRIFVVLSQFITRENIQDLVVPFRKMVDELTPYYQERIRALPPLQRKIVEFLCKSTETVAVKMIAKRMLSTHQTVSSQLKDLRAKGYVKSHAQGRESLYEVSEPLMRICVEVKENQTYGPLRLLVDFIRVWYEAEELTKRKEASEPGSMAYFYFQDACERTATEGNLRQKILLEDLKERIPTQTWGEKVKDLLKALEDAPEELSLALECLTEGKNEECLELLSSGATRYTARALMVRGDLFNALSEKTKAIADYTAVVAMDDAPTEQVAMALVNRGVAHGQSGDLAQEIADFTAVVAMDDAPTEQVARVLINRGVAHGQSGDLAQEIADYTAVVAMDDAPTEQVARALNNRGITHGQSGDLAQAIADFTAVVAMDDAPTEQVARALVNRGVAYGQSGDLAKKIADYTAVIAMDDAPTEQVAMALINRGVAYGRSDAFEAAERNFSALLQIQPESQKFCSNAFLGLAEVRARQGRWDEAFEQLDKAILSGKSALPEYVGDLVEMLGILFQAGLAKRPLDAHVRKWLALAQRREVLVELGESLVRHLGVVKESNEELDRAWLERWAELWMNAANDLPELAISMRMFRYGVRYLCSKNRDETILHHLKSEERVLLRKTLALDLADA